MSACKNYQSEFKVAVQNSSDVQYVITKEVSNLEYGLRMVEKDVTFLCHNMLVYDVAFQHVLGRCIY